MDVSELTVALEEYLAEHPRATVAEDDEVVFSLPEARYSVSGERGKCLLHLWSAERNLVRRVVEVEERKNELRLTVQRFGQPKTNLIHLMPDGRSDSPATRTAARAWYRQALRRALQSHFPEYTVDRFTSAPDLEHSFGPVYARGTLHRGRTVRAVLAAGVGETQASIDSSVTTGLLWLDRVREKSRGGCEGLMLVVPAGQSAVVRTRMAWLAARHRLLEFDEREGALTEVDCSDGGNIQTRLVHAPNVTAVLDRFAEPIARVRALLPDAEVSVPSSSEIVFRYRGLEFARSRVAVEGGSFRRGVETVFGIGAEETPLADDCPEFAALVEHVRRARSFEPNPCDPLWRLAAERWMESLVVENVAAIDRRLDQRFVYSQVPAFSASDRAMIDVLTCTREGRLVVLELKADEDFHLPIQGLDYWARVRWHNERGEFEKFGYFAGREISSAPPLLLLVAPALRVHPRTDAILRHVSSDIEWEFVAVDERWRAGLKVVFRKRRA